MALTHTHTHTKANFWQDPTRRLLNCRIALTGVILPPSPAVCSLGMLWWRCLCSFCSKCPLRCWLTITVMICRDTQAAAAANRLFLSLPFLSRRYTCTCTNANMHTDNLCVRLMSAISWGWWIAIAKRQSWGAPLAFIIFTRLARQPTTGSQTKQ